jgi:hypothetical protein
MPKPTAPTAFIAALESYRDELNEEKDSIEQREEDLTDQENQRLNELEDEISETEQILDLLGAY